MSQSVVVAAARDGHRFLQSYHQHIEKRKRRRTAEQDIIIQIPWNAKIFKAAGSLKDSIRRKILEMALDRIRGAESLKEILRLKAVPCHSLRENPYLGRGHSPYDNFVDSLLKARLFTISEVEALCDAILEVACDGPTKENLLVLENQGLRLVFHGTHEASMDSILKTGLLPNFRKSGNQEWFGVHYTTSLGFSKPYGIKLLFFMVLRPVDYVSYVTSASNVFQLPLAEITVGHS